MWLIPQKTADLVTFTENNLSGKLHFWCSSYWIIPNLELNIKFDIESQRKIEIKLD